MEQNVADMLRDLYIYLKGNPDIKDDVGAIGRIEEHLADLNDTTRDNTKDIHILNSYCEVNDERWRMLYRVLIAIIGTGGSGGLIYLLIMLIRG